LQLKEKLYGSRSIHTAKTLHTLAQLYNVTHRFVYAEGLFRKCIGMCEELMQKSPTKELKNELSSLYAEYSSLLKVKGRQSEAISLDEKANELAKDQ